MALLGGIEVGHQAPGRPHCQGNSLEPKPIEAGQAKAAFEGGAGFWGLKGGAGYAREVQTIGAPGGLGPFRRGPQHFGGVHLQQLLVQQITALALGDLKFARAHIRYGQAPAGSIALGA